MAETDNVIELPQEYINWLDEQQDLGMLIALATSNFYDALEQTGIATMVCVELVTKYGKALIQREMGRRQE